jgi:hypothetical protein
MEHLTGGLPDNSKFAIIAMSNVATDIQEALISYGDSTFVSVKLPFNLAAHWLDWLGRIESDNLTGCNLFIERFRSSGVAANELNTVDSVNTELQSYAYSVFSLLHLLGTWEYERGKAYLLTGYIKDGIAEVRQFTKLRPFDVTRGYARTVVIERSILQALELHRAVTDLKCLYPDDERLRFWRGYRALMDALKRHDASDRLHGFVRSLEALILPEKSNTERQFVERCGIMAAPDAQEAKTRQMLGEAYKLRSDVEHVNEWDRSLVRLPSAEVRENHALWRTRQVEALACAAYRRILLNKALHQHFMSDGDMRAFWDQRNISTARKLMGNVFDITAMPLVTSYHWGGRAF